MLDASERTWSEMFTGGDDKGRGRYTSTRLKPFVFIVQLAVDPASDDRFDAAYQDGIDDWVFSVEVRA